MGSKWAEERSALQEMLHEARAEAESEAERAAAVEARMREVGFRGGGGGRGGE